MIEPELLRVVAITDRRRMRGDFGAAVAAAVAGGATAVMLREKDLATDDLVRLGAAAAEACRSAGALLLVNGDLAAARRLEAAGVHLGRGAPGVAEARAALGPAAAVGRSTHDREELADALGAGADYVTFSPVWDTASKRGVLAPRGVAALADAVRAAGNTPVVALGGVTPERVAAARAAGAAGVAAIGAVWDSGDPRAAAAALRAAWEASA